MRQLSRPLLALLALTPLLHARLEDNLPASAYGVAKIESVAKSRGKLEANPLAAALRSDRFLAWAKPFTDAPKPGAAPTPATRFAEMRDALLEAFDGEVVFAFVKTPDTAPGHLPYDHILLADTDRDEAGIAELLKKLDLHQPVSPEKKPAAPGGSGEPSTTGDEPEPLASTEGRPRLVSPEIHSGEEVHHGVTLHTLSVKTEESPVVVAGWALIGKTFVYATAPNVLRDLVDARREGRKDNFTEQAVYKTNREALENSDAWLLLNAPVIAGTLRELVVEKSTGPDGETLPGLMGMDTLKAYDSLGLDAIEHFRISVNLDPEDTRSDTSLAWSENRGLIRFITDATPKDAVPDLSVMPSGVMVAGAGRADLSKLFARLESLLKEALPLAAPMFDMQVDRLKREESLDLRGALLENFGDEIWSFSDPMPAAEDGSAPDMAPFVIVLSLKDENKVNSFIETVAGKAAPQTGDGVKSLFEEREILGVRVRAVKNLPPSAPRIQYAITKGRVFIAAGDGKLLDRTLAQFNDPKGGLASEPAFKAGLARLPKGASSVNYYDLGEYVTTFGKNFAAGYANATRRGGAEAPRLDPEKAPVAADLPFIAMSAGVVHEKEASTRTIILRKPDAKN